MEQKDKFTLIKSIIIQVNFVILFQYNDIKVVFGHQHKRKTFHDIIIDFAKKLCKKM